MTPQIVARYAERQLPRYTSYPTAPHFETGIGPDQYAEWLGKLDADAPVSIYLHVPFCRSMCWYCGCHTTVTARAAPVGRYLAALRAEIMSATSAAPKQLSVRHLHFGGGTPSLMAAEQFRTLMALLRGRFRIEAEAEIAIELDPRSVDDAMVAALAEGGVTRASLGVQSFDPAVQQAINRVQSFAQTAALTAKLRHAGVSALSFDLIYGLPHQTLASCIETVRQCLTLRPARFSVFGYAHMPGFKLHQRKIDETTLADGAARHAQAEAIAEELVAAGYMRVGLDHYALPDDELACAFAEGRLRRNFQGYTTDGCETLIGFGASAIGRFPQGYVQNAVGIGEYEVRVGRHGTGVAKSRSFVGEDRLRAAVIERIMCDYRANLGEICARFGADATALVDETPELRTLARDGLVRVQGDLVEVAEAARPLVRVVAAAFDQYLARAPGRHSRAV